MSRFVASTSLPVSQKQAFDYHERPGALQRLVPPWQDLVIESSDGSLKTGSRVVLKTWLGPIPLRWVAEHTSYDPPHLFADIQRSGPFASWTHQHRFIESGEDACVLEDRIEYKVPLGAVGQFFGGSLARKELETMFSYRHQVTRHDMEMFAKYSVAPMRIAVSGCSGLVGRKLCSALTLLGHEVIRLERSQKKASDSDSAIAPWDSESEAAKLTGVDAVVHLAGKPIAEGRWSSEVKKQIRDSRVELTGQLAQALARLDEKPKVFVCASAIGIYGDRGDEELTEASELGDTFLADVAKEWEQSCAPAAEAGIRVVNARLGVVLDPAGGALKKMLFPARMCGGALGSGRQWWSWIAVDDVVGAIYHAVCTESISGALNVTAPEPLTNKEFARILGRVLSRPALFPAPAFALRLGLGELADAILLGSHRVLPTKLIDTGYEFRFSDAESALRYCLGKNRLESLE